MPELPEVETVARQLAEAVRGRTIIAVEIDDPKLEGLPRHELKNRKIVEVFRSGKQIVFALAAPQKRRGTAYLLVHLRMTGRLIWQPSEAQELPRQRARFTLDQGVLAFVDTRRFGTIRYATDPAAFIPPGQEPLADSFTAAALERLIGTTRQEAKVWLLRQDRLVGIGNIYASEILFAARVHPERLISRLTAPEIKRLHRATRRILNAAIAHCGTTFSDFQDSSGQSGGFARFLKVYGRDGERCRNCASAIERTAQQGRSTFFCPSCQPADPTGGKSA